MVIKGGHDYVEATTIGFTVGGRIATPRHIIRLVFVGVYISNFAYGGGGGRGEIEKTLI